MKKILKTVAFSLISLFAFVTPALAVNITVPSAPTSGYFLVSTTTGQYVASSSPSFLNGIRWNNATGTNATTTNFFSTTASSTNLFTTSFGSNLLFSPDNTLDIGSSAALRPRNIYSGTDINAGAQLVAGSNLAIGGSSYMYFTGRSMFRSPSDGVVKMSNAAETDFNRLQFGGTTSSFPSLKRAGTTLQLRLADDSDNADFQARATSLSSTLTLPQTGTIAWGSGSLNGDFAQIADGVTRMRTTAGNGFALSAVTDGVLTIRNKTNGANADLIFANSTSTNATTTTMFSTTASSTNLQTSIFGVASSTPVSAVGVGAGKAITVAENKLATSTSMTIDWTAGNQQLIQKGTAGITLTFSNVNPGARLSIVACNPGGSGGSFTFPTSPTILWPGGTAPTQTTTANKCDLYTFAATYATSTATTLILGGFNQNY